MTQTEAARLRSVSGRQTFSEILIRAGISSTINKGKRKRGDIFLLLAWLHMINSGYMKVDLGIWDKLTRLVIFLLFIAGLLGLAIWYLPLIKQNERWRKEILRFDVQIKKEQETGRQLQAAIKSLRTDSKAVERLARETFGYAKPGETVIRFEEPATNHNAR